MKRLASLRGVIAIVLLLAFVFFACAPPPLPPPRGSRAGMIAFSAVGAIVPAMPSPKRLYLAWRLKIRFLFRDLANFSGRERVDDDVRDAIRKVAKATVEYRLAGHLPALPESGRAAVATAIAVDLENDVVAELSRKWGGKTLFDERGASLKIETEG